MIAPDRLAIQSRYTGTASHRATEVEIWLSAGGELFERVWSLRTTDPSKLTSATLADGSFAAGFDGLAPWTPYSVRVRHSEQESCGFGEWSEPQEFRTDDGSAQLFDSGQIRAVYIDLSEESMTSISAEAMPPGCVPYERNYHPGTVRFEGQTFEHAGVRVKGGCGSARTLDGKAAFKINLSWDDPNVPGCPEDRRLRGLKRLTLNSQVQDRSFIHERLAYHYLRLLGVPSLRNAPIRVFVNDNDYGLYLNVESIDRRMLARNFESNRGMLYEGIYGCDIDPDSLPSGDVYCWQQKFSADECSMVEAGDDPLDFSILRQLANDIAAIPQGSFYPEITDRIAFDEFLSLWAADTVMANWDDYFFVSPNNYRIYHDPATDLWTLIPSGLDQTFKPEPDSSLVVRPFEVAGVLAERCLQETDCEAAFAARLAEAVEIFENAELEALARQLEGEVAPDVESDPRKEGTNEQFRAAVNETIDFIRSRPDEVRAMLAQRGY